MNLKIDDTAMKDLLSHAILSQIDTTQRDNLIQGALTYLITEQSGGYGQQKITPLIQAFNNAVSQTTQKIAMEYISTNPEIQQKITDLIKDAFVKVFDEQRDATVEKI